MHLGNPLCLHALLESTGYVLYERSSLVDCSLLSWEPWFPFKNYCCADKTHLVMMYIISFEQYLVWFASQDFYTHAITLFHSLTPLTLFHSLSCHLNWTNHSHHNVWTHIHHKTWNQQLRGLYFTRTRLNMFQQLYTQRLFRLWERNEVFVFCEWGQLRKSSWRKCDFLCTSTG